MQPIVRMAVAAAALSALLAALASKTGSERPRSARGRAGPAPSSALPSPCPSGTLPDHGVCIPVPRVATSAAQNPRWRLHDTLPRLPDRPASWARYRYPVSVPAAGPHLLDASADARHQGLAIAAEPGATVHALALGGQAGPASVIFVGSLVGTTVITRHTVTEHGRKQHYLVVDGGLARAAPGLRAGATLGAGAALGTVGSGGHLYLEVRRLRHGIDPTKLSARALLDDARTIACDPRNVLPLR